MISLILPYWNRPWAARAALDSLDKHYVYENLEVVIVDDGSPMPLPALPDDLNIRILKLPVHDVPRSCIAAWNHGVKHAAGEWIALSCIEVVHERPVLEELRAEAERRGPTGYALAAAWCQDQGRWHCHSTVRVPDCPIGTGLNFCGVLKREFFREIGGFDERYMVGAGYEDRDFIRRAAIAGANFRIRDDLVVQHPKKGATIDWGAQAFDRNYRVYCQVWGEETCSR